MSKTIIYYPNGAAIYPDNAADADEEVMRLMGRGVALHVDPSSRRVVAKVRIRDKPGARTQLAIVHHVWDDPATVFDNLLDELRGLQRSRDDGPKDSPIWEIFLDEDNEEQLEQRYRLLWLVVSLRDLTLDDLGLGIYERLVYRFLLQEEEQLSVGMSGYEASVVALRQFVSRWRTPASIAILPNQEDGAHPRLESTTFEMVVGGDTNFDPLTDETRRKLSKRYEAIKGNFQQALFEHITDTIENRLENEESPSQKLADLELVKEAVARDGGGVNNPADVDNPAVSELLRTIDSYLNVSIEENETPAVLDLEELASPSAGERTEVLSNHQQRELRRDIESYLEKRLSGLSTEMRDRAVDDLSQHVRNLEQALRDDKTHTSLIEELEAQYKWLKVLRRLADNPRAGLSRDPDDVPAPVAQFDRRIAGLNDNEYLSTPDQSELLMEVLETIETEQKEIRTAAQNRLETKLDSLITEVSDSQRAPEQKARDLRKLRNIFEQIPSGIDRTQLAEGDMKEKHIRSVERVAETEILREEKKGKLVEERLNRIDDELESIRDQVNENFKSRFNPIHRNLQRYNETTDKETVGQQLWIAQQICAGSADNGKRRGGQLDELRQLVTDIKTTPVLKEEDELKLLSQFEDQLSDAEESIREHHRENLEDQFENELDRLIDSATSSARAYEQLDTVQGWIETKTIDSDPTLPDIASLVENVVWARQERQGYELVDDETRTELNKEFTKQVRERKTKLVDQTVESREQQIREIVDRAVSHSTDNEDTIDRLIALKCVLDRFEKNGSKRKAQYDEAEDLWTALDEASEDAPPGVTQKICEKICEKGREKLVEEFNSVWPERMKELEQKFQTALESKLQSKSETTTGTLSAIDENIDTLTTYKEQLDSTGGGTGDRHSETADTLTDLFETQIPHKLPGRALKELKHMAMEQVEDLLEERRKQRQAAIDTWVEEEIENIRTYDDHRAKLRALVDLKHWMDPNQVPPSEPHDLIHGDIGRYVDELDRKTRVEKVERVDEEIETLIDEWKAQIVADVSNHLSKMLRRTGEDHKQAFRAVHIFKDNLPNPGDYADGELNAPVYDKPRDEAARRIGEFVAVSEGDSDLPIKDADRNQLKKEVDQRLTELIQKNQSNNFLRRNKEKVILRFVRLRGAISNARRRVVSTLLSGGGVAIVILVLGLVVAGMILGAPGTLSSDPVEVLGSDGSGGGTGAAAGGVTNLAVTVVDNGTALQVNGSVTGNATGVSLGVTAVESGEQLQRTAAVTNSTFTASMPIETSEQFVLTVTPRPNGEPTTFRWNGPVGGAGRGSTATTTATRTPNATAGALEHDVFDTAI